MKTCSKCKKEKSVEEFSKDASAKSGLSSICRACDNARNAEYRAANRESINAKQAEHDQTPAGRESQRKAKAKQRAKSPEKAKARKAVSNALKNGTLVRQPCLVCGVDEGVQAHHDSYHEERRLDVRWLCAPHHLEHHALMKKVMAFLAPYNPGLL
tara:strand:+ start:1342 stop:1809 length:468 start_codon:yes stop_codon:yes gene_type:complete